MPLARTTLRMQQRTRFKLVKNKRVAGSLATRFNLPAPTYCKVFIPLTNQGGNPCWLWQLSSQQSHLAAFISKRLGNVLCAFVNSNQKRSYAIAWWQNGTEVKRCGHGTLAAAAALNKSRGYFKSATEVINSKRSANGQHSLCFAKAPMREVDSIDTDIDFGPAIKAMAKSPLGYTLIELQDCQLGHLSLDINAIKAATTDAVILLAFDVKKQRWQTRYFAPHYGNDEDKATASALALTGPWLHQRYGMSAATIYQMAGAGSVLHYHCLDNKVAISGKVLISF